MVTSEWDTQIGKQLRKLQGGKVYNPIFSTNVGIRCAEPCSVTVAATHQMLTNMLLYLMSQIHRFPEIKQKIGSSYSDLDIAELRQLGTRNIEAMAEICGVKGRTLPTDTERALRKQGEIWSQHALEAPISWILCAVYIFATLISGWPLAYAIGYGCGIYSHTDEYSSAPPGPLNPAGDVGVDDPHGFRYLIAFFDAIIYLFLPQWTTFLIRLVQGRHLFHRMGVRSIVIGDIPWVAQCVEAFGSKLFGCAYSNASFNFYSANPSDHLVHRFTHRVVRGGLLLVGRPDGRLSALTSAEASVCLAVNQASSIQSLGVRCESVTVGHNPYKLPLSERALVLPTCRPDYLCEHVLKEKNKLSDQGKSPNALLGDFINIKEKAKTGAGPLGGDEEDRRSVEIRELLPRLSQSPYSFHNLSTLTSTSQIYAHKTRATQSQYFGELLLERDEEGDVSSLMMQQSLSQRLYESRYASLQRCVACFVLLHETGKRVSQFWSTVSFGLLGYEMHRTHSIMRIATTASPISGSEVRTRMLDLALAIEVKSSQRVIRKFLRKVLIARASRGGVDGLLKLLERPLFKSQSDLTQIGNLIQEIRSGKGY